jgi:RNA polymerase sigma-70 factor (ECF subfamily)
VTDAAFVRRVCSGEAAAFDEFFTSYFPRLYRFAFARLNGNEDASEEVAQRTLIRGLDRLHTYRGDAALFTWLCTLCRHEIADWLARERRGRPILLSDESEAGRTVLGSLAADETNGPEDALQRREVTRLVHATLDDLPEKYADALEWKYLDDLPVEQIAGRLGLGYKAAESLLTRARAAFRDSFSRLAGNWPATPRAGARKGSRERDSPAVARSRRD